MYRLAWKVITPNRLSNYFKSTKQYLSSDTTFNNKPLNFNSMIINQHNHLTNINNITGIKLTDNNITIPKDLYITSNNVPIYIKTDIEIKTETNLDKEYINTKSKLLCTYVNSILDDLCKIYTYNDLINTLNIINEKLLNRLCTLTANWNFKVVKIHNTIV